MKEKMIGRFYFDTYALIEVYKGNSKYEKYKDNVDILLNKLNLMEYISFLMRESVNEDFGSVFKKFEKYCVDYDDSILIEAVRMKIKYKKEDLSFVDCIGYCLAKKHGARFLTGDSDFKDKENVEFVPVD